MKKFILSSFILFLSFFGIKNVNAETLQLTSPISAHWYGNGDNDAIYNYGTSTTIDRFNFLGGNTYYHTFRTTFNMRGFSQLDQSKNYTMSFYIYLENLAYGTNPSMVNVYAPVVRFAGQTCYVQPFGFTTTTNPNAVYYYSGIYNVICDNVTLNSDIYDVDVFTIQEYISNTSPNLYQGITPEWSVIENNKTLNEIVESNTQIKDSVNDLNSNITSSNTDESQTQANSFFEGFESDDYGLSDIITMPLELIRGLTSNSCVALNLTIPFVNKSFDLPCMSSIYSQYFGNFFTLYQTITFGFVAYWVVVKIFALVKGFKDPDDDKVEVMDL